MIRTEETMNWMDWKKWLSEPADPPELEEESEFSWISSFNYEPLDLEISETEWEILYKTEGTISRT